MRSLRCADSLAFASADPSMAQDDSSAADKAEELGQSAPVEALARMGLVAYGLVHLLIGWSALVIAWGGSRAGAADSSGALKTLAAQPFGRLLLALVAIGLLALAAWQITEAIWGVRDRTGMKRRRKQISNTGKAAFYATLGVSAAEVALDGGRASGSSSNSQQRATSGVLAWPGGQSVVVLAGLAILAVGVASARRGLTKSFRKEIDSSSMSEAAWTLITRLGQVGHLAKGVALGTVGSLLIYAAWTFDPQKSRGLDGALRKIVEQPFGNVLLTAVALGLMAFGLFAVVQSRYRRM